MSLKSWDNRKGRKPVTVPFGSKKGRKAVPLGEQKLKKDWRGRIIYNSAEQATGEVPVDYRQDSRFMSRRGRR